MNLDLVAHLKQVFIHLDYTINIIYFRSEVI